MAREEWEEIIAKIQEQDRITAEKREQRYKHADMLPIALRHLEKLMQAVIGNNNDLSAWAEAWDTAEGFLKYARSEGLL